MNFLAKASALFIGLRVSSSYHQALQVPPVKEMALQAAKRDIRSAIRAAATSIQLNDAAWEPEFASRAARNRPSVGPRFFTQGSVAYNLLVDPCQSPPQQLDLDDGMYVRVEFLNGRPALVARALFEMVEAALAPLCRARGWILNPPPAKSTCVRVQISRDSHIDIPIYSAPSETVETLSFNSVSLQKSMVDARSGREYARLPSDEIMLANRDGTWQPSDPLKLHEWVDACAERYGEEFRRACRYIKGWRDFAWKGCCLSSIAIMAGVATAFDELQGAHRRMADDELVYEIAQRLPAIFEGTLLNPAYPGKSIVLNDWRDDERKEVVAAARVLAQNMHDALKGTAVADLVVAALRRAFGNRIPLRPDMIEIAAPVAAVVLAEKAAAVPAPRIIKSTQG